MFGAKMRDVVGASLSVLCMIHCFLPLIVLSFGASLGLHQVAEHMHHDLMHFVLLIPIVLLLVFSLPKSYKQHGNIAPAILAVTGLVILVIALMTNANLETPLTIFGSVFVIGAHLLNRKTIKTLKAVTI